MRSRITRSTGSPVDRVHSRCFLLTSSRSCCAISREGSSCRCARLAHAHALLSICVRVADEHLPQHAQPSRTPPPNRMNCCTHTHPLCTHQALEKKGEDRSLGCLANKVESYPRRAVCVHTAVCQKTPRAAMCVARTGLSHALRGATQDEGMGAPRVCVVRHFARAY